MVLELRLEGHAIRMVIDSCLSTPYLQVTSAPLLGLLVVVNYITSFFVIQVRGLTVVQLQSSTFMKINSASFVSLTPRGSTCLCLFILMFLFSSVLALGGDACSMCLATSLALLDACHTSS